MEVNAATFCAVAVSGILDVADSLSHIKEPGLIVVKKAKQTEMLKGLCWQSIFHGAVQQLHNNNFSYLFNPLHNML